MKVEIWQRTPISYYGGKQTMLKHILPLIPKHRIYTEAFFGGGAVFWAKEPSEVEVVNDFNANVYNFYQVLKTDFEALKKLIESTVISRESYKSALVTYHSPYIFTNVQRAWAFWYATNFGFSNQIGNIRICNTPKYVNGLKNKIERFTDEYSTRLQRTQIENEDACKIISLRDSEDAFHYVDPPYVGANQGRYGGYTQEHFNELLDTLSKCKGKFLLSSYHNEALTEAVEKYGWYQKEVVLHLGSSKTKGKKRVEVLTANYDLDAPIDAELF